MLFKSKVLKGISNGNIDLAFRRWKRPTVKTGGTLLTPIGQLSIISVSELENEEITSDDLRRAGFSRISDLHAELGDNGKLFRIEFKILGEDPRLQLRQQFIKSEREFEELRAKLSQMDSRAARPWTAELLLLIKQFPETVASRLAEKIDMPKMEFKTKVRRLKNLGLTISHNVGYSLSPRGKSYLKWTSND